MSTSGSNRIKRASLIPLIALSLVICCTEIARAQDKTIPERLEEAGHSLEGGRLTSARTPSMEAVLRDTDVIIRGRISVDPHSYLSDNQREIYTDYEILNPEFLYPVKEGTLTPSVVVIKHLGGTVTINGLGYTFHELRLPKLPADTVCLFLLKRVGDKYRIALGAYGAFSIDDGKLKPLTSNENFAPEYRGESATKAAAEFVAKARKLSLGR